MTRAQKNRRANKPRIDGKCIASLTTLGSTCAPQIGDRVYVKRNTPQIGGRAGTILATETRYGGVQLRLEIDNGWRVRVSLADTIALDEGMARPSAEPHDINERPYATVLG